MREKIRVPERFSWSSMSSVVQCGERWRIERGHRAPVDTWLNTLAGRALHVATESEDRFLYDPSTPVISFNDAFDKELLENGDTVARVTGQKRLEPPWTDKYGPNGWDEEWWRHWGEEFVARWCRWRTESGWEIATMPDGKPGIELPVEIPYSHGMIVGYVDRVFITPQGQVVVVDIKSKNLPAWGGQFDTYMLGLEHTYGVRADLSGGWLPTLKGRENGGIPFFRSRDDVDEQRLLAMYAHARATIESGAFVPNPSDGCLRACVAKDYCWAMNGQLAHLIPRVSEFDTSPGDGVDSAPDITEGKE